MINLCDVCTTAVCSYCTKLATRHGIRASYIAHKDHDSYSWVLEEFDPVNKVKEDISCIMLALESYSWVLEELDPVNKVKEDISCIMLALESYSWVLEELDPVNKVKEDISCIMLALES